VTESEKEQQEPGNRQTVLLDNLREQTAHQEEQDRNQEQTAQKDRDEAHIGKGGENPTELQGKWYIIPKNSRKTLRIGTCNLQKGVETKLMQIQKLLDKGDIDILLTQEWGGWAQEYGKFSNSVRGYTNFMSFKTKAGTIHENVSLVAMTATQRNVYRKKTRKPRKRGTTILVRNELINELNVNETKIQKDREIEMIELVMKGEKIVILSFHAEPDRDIRKKEKFYAKLTKIITENIATEAQVLLGGDANSVWTTKDTSKENKRSLDQSVKKFCKKMKFTDICRKVRKREKTKKEREEEGEQRNHTWESDTEDLSKRLDSFWGAKRWIPQISKVQTLGEHWMRSDHRVVIIDWETDSELPEKQTEGEDRREATNKQICEKMTQNKWENYKEKIREKLNKQGEGIEEIEQADTQKRLQTLQKWMNEALKQEQEKRTENNQEKVKKKNIQITKLNITLNMEWKEKKKPSKEREGERTYTTKLPKGTDGKTAKLTNIRNRLYSYTKTIRKLLKEKKEDLGEREWNWIEKFGKMTTELKLTRQSTEEEKRQALTTTNRIIKYLTNKIHRRRAKLLQKNYYQAMKELEQEEWSNSKKFFQKVMKKRKKRISIRKVPERLMKGEGRDTDPEKIKEMIREYWQQLYSKEKQEKKG